MSAHRPVPLDDAQRVKELAKQGLGRNNIGAITGIPSSSVQKILKGTYTLYCDKLTTRQIQNYLRMM